MTVRRLMFENPRCNLHHYWRQDPTALYFRWVADGSPLCRASGTMVCVEPFSTFLFPMASADAGKPQFEWKPFELAIEGRKTASGVWMGLHKQSAGKFGLTIPDPKKLYDRRINTAS